MDRDFRALAEVHGLVYVEVASLSVCRRRSGRGFTYLDADGARITDPEARKRYAALVLPPAWEDVRLAADPRAHIQAVGRDTEGRLQYRYHDDWTRLRDRLKLDRLLTFGRVLPRIREQVEKDINRKIPDRAYAAAVATRLIDRAHLRAGHSGDDEGGRGATTLLKRDVRLNGTTVTLAFVGKSGKDVRIQLRDPVLLRRLRVLRSIGKKRLFAYRSERGGRRYLSARELNDYLREISGAPISSKDFRTFAASALAVGELVRAERPNSPAAIKRVEAKVVRSASDALRNTPAVARSSYVHPSIFEAYEQNALGEALLRPPLRTGLSAEETALMRFLEAVVEAETRAKTRRGRAAERAARLGENRKLSL